jgi:hypothetical protein
MLRSKGGDYNSTRLLCTLQRFKDAKLPSSLVTSKSKQMISTNLVCQYDTSLHSVS